MAAFKRKQARRGRPSRGHDGTKVRDYPALLIRIAPGTRQLLVALSNEMGRSQSNMITDALWVYQYNYLRTYDLTRHHQVQKRLSDVKRQRNKSAKQDL